MRRNIPSLPLVCLHRNGLSVELDDSAQLSSLTGIKAYSCASIKAHHVVQILGIMDLLKPIDNTLIELNQLFLAQ